MTLETTVQSILDRGRTEADQIILQARGERERMLDEVRAEGNKAIADEEARAHEAAARRRIQELARGDLDARKIVLATQKEALDEVYRRTLGRLTSLQDREPLLRALLQGNEDEWRSGRVYANANDETAVRRMVGKQYVGRIECAGGVVIEAADGSRRIDCRFESILTDVWNDSVREVAEILWPLEPSKS